MTEETKYLFFVELDAIEGKKTCTWRVNSKQGHYLGHIKWFGAWRKYCFFPDDGTIFDAGCLNDIASFCERHHKDRVHEKSIAG